MAKDYPYLRASNLRSGVPEENFLAEARADGLPGDVIPMLDDQRGRLRRVSELPPETQEQFRQLVVEQLGIEHLPS